MVNLPLVELMKNLPSGENIPQNALALYDCIICGLYGKKLSIN